MSRRNRFEPEPDRRPIGVVNFASTLGDIPSQVRTFNEPHSPCSYGENEGIRSVEIQPAAWYHGGNTYAESEQYRSMNRRLGIEEEE